MLPQVAWRDSLSAGSPLVSRANPSNLNDVIGQAVANRVGHQRSADVTMAVLDALETAGWRFIAARDLAEDSRTRVALAEALSGATAALDAALRHGDLSAAKQAVEAGRRILHITCTGARG